MRNVGALLLALEAGMVGCGGSINGNGGPDGSTQPGACASLDACACYAASDRCSMRTEPCWCPSECDPNIACICGGGQFLGCQDKMPTTTTACAGQVARVQALCPDNPFVQYIASACSGSDPACLAGCLATLQDTAACIQIDCSFCTTCDCLAPAMPSALRTCVNACNLPPPPLR